MSDILSRERVLVPMPMDTMECVHCAGTGGPPMFEHSHYIWLAGEPQEVCGACKGAGRVSRWGRRLSARKVIQARKRMAAILKIGEVQFNDR